ncbi:MAG: GxxExxY protein [Planctomycetota bacterium]
MHTDGHGLRPGDAALEQITEAVIGCAFEVQNVLGCGFLEKVYENALVHACRRTGLAANQQVPVKVLFDGVVVGDYVADIVIENTVLIELKAASGLTDVHRAQCLNYLKATGYPVCLLLNFGKPRVEVKRLAL